ncbi:hypothetical protein LIA77_08867 [Sarocladium implicatum]|nr:hypothetical protein LIA77_08867 [Sarocladium implicatum]
MNMSRAAGGLTQGRTFENPHVQVCGLPRSLMLCSKRLSTCCAGSASVLFTARPKLPVAALVGGHEPRGIPSAHLAASLESRTQPSWGICLKDVILIEYWVFGGTKMQNLSRTWFTAGHERGVMGSIAATLQGNLKGPREKTDAIRAFPSRKKPDQVAVWLLR